MSEVDYGNHSCDPNVWLASTDDPVLVARRDISPGEELTTDYVFWTDNDGGAYMQCECGSTHCRGVLTGDDWKLPTLQNEYRGHWPAFLQQRIAEEQQRT